MNLDIDRISKLARISLTDVEKQKYSKDLEKILDHFTELEKLNTEDILPMSGGTDLKNIFRNDADTQDNISSALKGAFPEQKDGYLKVPKIFD